MFSIRKGNPDFSNFEKFSIVLGWITIPFIGSFLHKYTNFSMIVSVLLFDLYFTSVKGA